MTELGFQPDASWVWLPWAAAAVLAIALLQTILDWRRGVKGPLALAFIGLGLCIIAYTFRTRGTAGYIGCASLLIIVSARWMVRSYLQVRTDQPVKRWAGMCLRLAVLLVAGLLLVRPVWKSRVVEYRRPVLLLAVDQSRSMNIEEDDPSGTADKKSRKQVVQDGFEQNAKALRQLRKTYEIDRYGFAQRAFPGDQSISEEQAGFTALGDALIGVADQRTRTSDRLGGILLISDGRNNLSVRHDPQAAAKELARRGIPLWVAGVGAADDARPAQSLVGRSLRFPHRVTEVTRLPIDADFEAAGLSGKTVRIDLWLDDRHIKSKTQVVQATPDSVAVRFDIPAPRAGIYQLEARAAALDTELTATLTDYLQVDEGRIRVLLLDRPRVEHGQIFRALARSRDLHIDRRFVRGPSPQALEQLLEKQPIDWNQHDVVVIGDVDLSGRWGRQQERLQHAVVTDGLGLLLLGGRLSLGQADGMPAPLQELLPVPAAAILQVNQPIRIKPTRAGLNHAVCIVSEQPEGNNALWVGLEQLDDAYTFGDRKPAAESLLETVDGQPVLLAHLAGRGRVAVLGLDQTWQWSLKAEAGQEIHRRFWRQLAVWLANRQPRLYVATDRPTYDLGKLKAGDQEVRAMVYLRGMSSQTETKPTEVQVGITGPTGAKYRLPLVRESDRYVGTWRPSQTGEYTIRAACTIDGEELQSEPNRFTVQQYDVELTDKRPDLELLRNMAKTAQMAGGAYADFREFGALLEEIQRAGRPQRIERQEIQSLVGQWKWPLFSLLVAMLAIEWALRKQAGLV